ncbi:MAG TPA: DUF6055 domain-containing protein [Bacteroidales bacterium]|nr:DUF6055 domain-containing protein [Bacteroidales bacterium]HOC03913.1 DUF6055 domain-containing protein [Bacteroidales bacterium]HPH74789.1 DUF6055 domain-containing protein [Bacteroidales bacterium]HPO40476.1 DUF6055 domain-containing protein [Bacteroidales bacterium]HQB52254.1 DUF6055 domain-containing protein [Bacteroidales bacterium]
MRSLESVSIRTGIFLVRERLCLAVLMLAMLTLASCREKPEEEANLVISAVEITASAAGGEASVQITSDQKWSITSIDQLWVDASIPEGVPGVTVTVKFTFEHNPTSSVRTANVTVVSGSTRGSITITQQAGFDPSSIDVSKIYIPLEMRSMDLNKSSSTWYFGRSRQSEHFIVFWGKGYDESGFVTPSDHPDPAYRVDIDDLLAKAEQFWSMNVNILKFLTPGSSKTDQYKMMIFLFYQTDWLATGAGYDNTIGALWVSPSTCQPVGSTIAHEIGHSFQYQVYCDNGGNSGWRYGFGGDGGNGYWEQCAQWQAYQSYPDEAFNSYNFNVYIDNCHRSTFHEWQRYANYFINYYWADKHGIDFIGRLWRESGAVGPEDPAQAYMRITGISLEQYNDEQFDYARRMVTWDLDALRAIGSNRTGAHSCSLNQAADGFRQIAPEKCIENHGYNVIRLNVPASGTVVTATFEGIAGAPGYRSINADAAGWRYGYVALLSDGTRVYSDMFSASSGTASFTCPENCSDLWFVVSGAPKTYWQHGWDEDESNDEQWPYRVKFSGTNIYGLIDFTDEDKPHDESFVYNISFRADGTGYTGTSVTIDAVKLCYAFVMTASEIRAGIGLPSSDKKIRFYGVNSNDTYASDPTANGYGHWFNAAGDVCAYVSGDGGENRIFSEFNETNFTFSIGQHPGRCKAGDVYRVRQAMVYSPGGGEKFTATFEFNITITP